MRAKKNNADLTNLQKTYRLHSYHLIAEFVICPAFVVLQTTYGSWRKGLDGDFLFSSSNPRVGHNEVIGVCRVGLDAEGLGRDHWNEMLAYPRKPITHWHPLVEVRGLQYRWNPLLIFTSLLY